MWFGDYDYLGVNQDNIKILDSGDYQINDITVPGAYNRLDAWLVVNALHEITGVKVRTLVNLVGKFPGLQRRMEEIAPNLYSDYAHTPEKIRGGMSVALEIAAEKNQDLIIVYEPLTNRRQHYMIDDYKDCFTGAKKVYWIPSYLAREDPDQRIIPPAEMISHLSDPQLAEPLERDNKLKSVIQKHLDAGDMVVGMAGGGGDSLDEWLRKEFVS
jgi:UDP-N-acetylmuramate-alanine ligase